MDKIVQAQATIIKKNAGIWGKVKTEIDRQEKGKDEENELSI